MTDARKALRPGAAILDSLTIQSALRILGEEGAVQAPSASRSRDDKWDYDLNYALRVAIDIECLAQLVHAIVMHEEISVSPGFVLAVRDGQIVTKLAGYMDFAPTAIGEGLNEIVTSLVYPEGLRRQLMLRAGERAVEISRTPDFRRYLKALSSGGLEGVVLEISNGYFETGYSDPSILSSFKLAKDNEDEGIYFGLATAEMVQAKRLTKRGLVNAAQEHIATAQRFGELGLAMQSMAREDDPLIEPPVPTVSYIIEKSKANPDVVRNAAAALYFQDLAFLANASYLPHVLRAPFVTFDPDSSPSVDPEQRVIDRLQALRRSRAENISTMIGNPGFDLEIPLVLARVLQDARGPHEVIPRALELRETASARRLRAWFRTLHEKLQTSEADMRYVEREVEGFRALMGQWAGSLASDGNATITMGINLGIVNFSLALPKRFRTVRRRWQLRFLYDLARAGDATPQLGPALGTALGEPIEGVWYIAQHTIKQFTRDTQTSRPISRSKNRLPGRVSPLDLREQW